MSARVILLPAFGALALFAAACNKGGEDGGKDGKAKTDGKANGDGKADGGAADDGEPTLKVAEGSEGVDGPVPPDASMVFFQVEGALIPLACFDKDKGTLAGGPACLSLVPAGADVRVSAGDEAFNKKVGERATPTCLDGSDDKDALSAENLTGGAEFTYGTWPPSGLKLVTLVPDETKEPPATQIDDDTKAKLAKAIPAQGSITAQQVAEIDVDGDDKKDGIYSAFIPHPKLQGQYAWSGVFLAPDGNLDAPVLLTHSPSGKHVFEVVGTLQADGKGDRELWIRMKYAEAAGDAVFQLEGNGAKPLHKWSCGVL
jgi:hypothetical protein